MTRNLALNRLFLQSTISVALCLVTALAATAQPDNTAFIKQQFDKHSSYMLQEKIFAHVDRSFYVAGEILWFKIYCLNEENNKLLDLSKVAYVEILNKDQQPIVQAKIGLKNGAGSGSLVLPSNIRSGNFTFRAYTNWMKNGDPDFYFHQNLSIVNTIQSDTLPNAPVDEKYDVQFFPEGGDMVNELESKVAFRVTDNSGKGIDFTGIIADDNNQTLLNFQPAAFGIGSFTFTPKKNRQYKAIITTAAGKIVTQVLPPARSSGFVMQLSNPDQDGALQMKFQTNTESNSAFLFIHTRQQLKIAQVLNFVDGIAKIEIDRNKLGEGISHLTLFNINNQPVCERLYFKRPQQQLFIDSKPDEVEYLPRKKVTIELSAKDESNEPQAADLSMSVFLVDSLPGNYKDIYSYLWMSSDLKGKVESPEYYFTNSSSQVNKALDNLMLTHGWRRFKWSDVMQDKKPELNFLPEFEGHIVSGKIIKTSDESAVENRQAFLSFPGRHFNVYNAISSNEGTVNFNTRDIYGSRLMVAQVRSPDSLHYRVDLSNPFSESFSTEKVPYFDPASALPANLLKRSINMQVQNVYADSKLSVFEPAKIDTLNFYGKPEITYLLDDYTRFPTMEEVLTEYVPEITIRKRRDQFSLRMVSKDEDGITLTREPVILLDGIPQFDMGDKIAHHDPLKIERLETINQTYFSGTARFDGIASFFTYKGDLDGFKLDSSSTVLDYETLQLKREFYTPVYETTEQYVSRLPDYRNLMYWSPDIQTSNTGTKQVSFYTSDLPGKYAVVMQGISQAGKTGFKMFTIEVKKDPLLTK